MTPTKFGNDDCFAVVSAHPLNEDPVVQLAVHNGFDCGEVWLDAETARGLAKALGLAAAILDGQNIMPSGLNPDSPVARDVVALVMAKARKEFAPLAPAATA